MKRPRALTEAELERHPLPSVEDGDKDSHGQLLIIAGSRAVPGAALLAAHGAMRVGAGKLRMAVPDDVAVALAVAMPEAMVQGFPTARDGGFTGRGAADHRPAPDYRWAWERRAQHARDLLEVNRPRDWMPSLPDPPECPHRPERISQRTVTFRRTMHPDRFG